MCASRKFPSETKSASSLNKPCTVTPAALMWETHAFFSIRQLKAPPIEIIWHKLRGMELTTACIFFFTLSLPSANAAASQMMTNETWSDCRVAKSIIVFTLVMINHYLLGALNESNKKAARNPHPSLGHRPVALRLSSNRGSPSKKNTISVLYGLAIGDLRECIEGRKKRNTYMLTITSVHRV